LPHTSAEDQALPDKTKSGIGYRRHEYSTGCFPALLGVMMLAGIPAGASLAATTTTLAITSAGNAVTTVPSGVVVTLTATVAAGSKPVTVGQVNFCDATAKYCTDIHLMATAQLTGKGTAVVKFRPGIGSHSYKAVFAGTKSEAASTSSAAALTVTGKDPTAITYTRQGTGGTYTLAATLVGFGHKEAQSLPTGTVSFLDTTNGNAVLATEPLATPVSALSLTNLEMSLTNSPVAMATGDLNGDGVPDLVFANSSNVSVLLGKGDGTFTELPEITVPGVDPYVVAVGDFNGDGIPDLALASSLTNTMAILLGNGDGTFTANANLISTGGWPNLLVVADFNGDGIPDLAVGNLCGTESSCDETNTSWASGTLTILLGKGDGTFEPAISTTTGYYTSSIAEGDFNGDGIPDLAVVNLCSSATVCTASGSTVMILLGNGDGTFKTASLAATITNPENITVGDFNGDGKADLAVASYEPGSVTILLGNGDGTFTSAPSLATVNYLYQVAMGDFNGDGIPDLVVLQNNNPPLTFIFLGNGDGTFTPAASGSPTVAGFDLPFSVLDLNGDGLSDMAGFLGSNTGSLSQEAVLLTHWADTATVTASGVTVTGTEPHQVVASYSADANYQSSTSAAAPLYPAPPASTTTLTVTSGGVPVTSVAPSSTVTLTAMVKTGSTTVTSGQVNFCDASAAHCTDIHLLGTAQLTSAGTAMLKFRPGVGSHSYKAVFIGTETDATSSSSIQKLTVTGKFPTTTAFAVQGVPGNYMLTATVTGYVRQLGTTPPSGTVSFLDTSDANAVLGTAPLGTGVTSLAWSNPQSLVTADQALAGATADFNGDGIPDLALTYKYGGPLTIFLGNGDGTFTAAPSSPPTGYYTWSIVAGDFNGDGKPDLAIVSQSSPDNTQIPGMLTILLGNGDGTFTAAPSPATGDNPASVAVGDFNGDGIPDLAVANAVSDTVTILLGNGDGTFTSAPSPATGVTPVSVAVGDFNGDGLPDLAVANYCGTDSACASTGMVYEGDTGTVTILLGNGDGTFRATATSPSTGYKPYGLAVGDFNGDGIPDVAVTNFNSGSITILLGNGDGTFGTVANSPTGFEEPLALAVADFNGDGIADLAVTGNGPSTILLGNGDGTFNTAASFPQGGDGVVSDFNGDGNPDFALVNGGADLVAIYLTQLTEAVSASITSITPGTPGANLATANYPGDANYDSSASASIPLYPVPPASTTALALSSGGAPVTTVASGSVVTLTATVKVSGSPITSGQVNFCDATAALCTDIHLLGVAQLSSAGTAALKCIPGIGSHSYKAAFVGTNTDAPSSSSASALAVTGRYPTATTIKQSGSAGNYTLTATVTGSVEKAGLASPTGTVSFLETSNGNAVLGTAALGTGGAAQSWMNSLALADLSLPTFVASGDFNGDGIPDLAVLNNVSSANLTILLGNGDGTFKVAPSPATTASYTAIAVGDFNRDGIPDLALTDYNDNVVQILLGNGDGTFQVASSPATGNGPVSIAVGDFNGDGIPDLAVTNVNSLSLSLTILLGNGDGTFTAVAASPAIENSPGYRSADIVVADFNGDGVQDLAVAEYDQGAVIILLGDGDGTFRVAPSQPPSAGQEIYAASLVVGDFNGDGKADLAVAGNCNGCGAGVLTVLLGNGDGTFQAAQSPANSPLTGATPLSIAVGDFNGDGIPDLATANYDGGTVTVLLGIGDGTFQATAVSPATGSGPISIAAGNFNGSGLSGLVVANQNSNNLSALISQLTESATASVSGISSQGAGSIQVDASYPGNATYSSSASLAVSLGSGLTIPPVTVTPSSSSIAATQPLTVTVAVSGGNGNPTPTGSVTLTSGSYATVPITLSGGNASINIPAGSLAEGRDTLTATYTPDAASSSVYNSASGTSSVVVGPEITTQPTNQTVPDGSTATFSVVATGAATLTYQWQYLSGTTWKAFAAGTGYKTASLTTFATTPVFNGIQLRVVVTDGDGLTATSNTAKLIVGPAITTQPTSQTVTDGSTATFSVAAAGVATLTYQWQYLSGTTWKAFAAGTGYSTATLTTFATTPVFNGIQLRVVVTDGDGLTATSNTAKLTVGPEITTQPTNQTVPDGSTATFSVVAAGVATLTYQWQYLSGTTWKAFGAGTGYNAASLTTFATTPVFNGIQLRVVVTDGDGLTATSNTAKLIVGPAITTQPASQTVTDGSTATFSVAAAGVATLTYQWQYLFGTTWKAFGAGTGYDTATLTTIATTATFNGMQFRVVVTDGDGQKAISNTATLTVSPAITRQPTSQSVAVGKKATFNVGATGVPTLTYQWQYLSGSTWEVFSEGTGATTATLTTVATTSAFNGMQFRVVVTDGNGLTATSNTVTLTVTSPPA
jgi:hypothetical protein